MRFNIYTSSIIIDSKHTLFYNALSGKFVILRDEIIQFNALSPDYIQMNYPPLYENLCNAGIVVEDTFAESDILEERIRKADNNDTQFILHINPTLDCNFNCWYCYENHIPASKMGPDVLNGIKNLISLIVKRDNIKILDLSFFGGEPMLFFHSRAREIIKHADALCRLYEKSLHISFTTNGALINDEIISFLSEYRCGFQITLDGYKTTHDKTRFYKNGEGSYNRIIENIYKLSKKGMSVTVRVNYTEENVHTIYDILDDFTGINNEQRNSICFDFQRIWQERSAITDDAEVEIRNIRLKFISSGFTVLKNYLHHNVDNSCYADKLNYALVNYNGDVYKCTARDFKKENRIGYLKPNGEIHYNQDVLHKRNSIKLSKDVCKKCRIAPVCGGGCNQRSFESIETDDCTFHYSEEAIDKMILDIFESSFITEPKNL